MAGTKGGSKRRSRTADYQSYIFRIENSDVSYSLRLDRSRWAEGPYSEHLELSVDGTIVAPEKLQGRRGVLTFLGDRRMTRDLESPIESRTQPLCVGTLTIWGETTGYLGSLPNDIVWHLVGSLSRDEIRMLALHGETLYRGQAKLLTVHFECEINR